MSTVVNRPTQRPTAGRPLRGSLLRAGSLTAAAARYRAETRRFLERAAAEGLFEPVVDCWTSGHSPAFSRRLGSAGLIGITWPSRLGGREATALDRYAVVEELLAAGAPIAAHWIADRQTGPLLFRYGSEAQQRRFLPQIARGECYFAIGMSEPDSGSDLASVRATATPAGDGGWTLSGQKVWTTHAARAHYMIVLCRTAREAERHEGLSQFIVDLSAPGVTVRPIDTLRGPEFAEVLFDDVRLDAGDIVGVVGRGWQQVTAELAFERSGPERFLTLYPLLRAFATTSEPTAPELLEALGWAVAQIAALRAMAIGVAEGVEAGEAVDVPAALVKELGTRFEQELVDDLRGAADAAGIGADNALPALLGDAVLAAPALTLRGGTNEILRGIIARGLGMR